MNNDRVSARVDVNSADLRSLINKHLASDIVALVSHSDEYINVDSLLGLTNEPTFSIQVDIKIP